MASRSKFQTANKRAQKVRSAQPRAIAAYYDSKSGRIVIELTSKLFVSFSPKDAEGLERARSTQLQEIEITPSGLGLHFPALDADLYIPALLEGMLGSRKWMAARMGAAGGSSTSPGKRRASRANGKLGGRPKKQVAG
jgi:hypothetical protein